MEQLFCGRASGNLSADKLACQPQKPPTLDCRPPLLGDFHRDLFPESDISLPQKVLLCKEKHIVVQQLRVNRISQIDEDATTITAALGVNNERRHAG